MPVIPILTANRPLGNVPSPVLDRERRPTVDNSGLIAANREFARATKQPLLPAEQLAAPYEAMGTVGRALQQGGSVLGALAIKVQEARTDAQVAEADGALDTALAETRTWARDTNADPATWVDNFGQRIDTLKQRLGERKDLTDGARRQIALRLERYKGQAANSLMLEASKQTFALAQSATVARLDRYTADGNKEAFEQEKTAALTKGYMFPHQAEAKEQEFKREQERRQKQAEADAERMDYELKAGEAIANPRQWLEDNASPWEGDELRWAKIKNIADSRLRETTADAIASIQEAIAKEEIKVPGQIDALDVPELSKAIKDKLKDSLFERGSEFARQDREMNAVPNAVDVREKVKEYSPKGDKDGERYFALLREINRRVPEGLRDNIVDILTAKFTGRTAPIRGEVAELKDKTLDTFLDAEKGMLPWKKPVPVYQKDATGKVVTSGPMFGEKKPVPVIGTDGAPKVELVEDLEARRRALAARAQVEIRFNEWAALNADKANDPVQVQKKLRELLLEVSQAAGWEAMKPKTKAPTPAPARMPKARDLRDTPLDLQLPSGLPSPTDNLLFNVP